MILKYLFGILNSSKKNKRKQSTWVKENFLLFFGRIQNTSNRNIETDWPLVANHFLPNLSKVHGRLEQCRKASYYLIQSGIIPIPYLQIWFGTLCQVVLKPSWHAEMQLQSRSLWLEARKIAIPIGKFYQPRQRYTYRVLQTIQMKLILLWVLTEQAVLGSAKTALKFKYEI